jgi:hypothetical protein
MNEGRRSTAPPPPVAKLGGRRPVVPWVLAAACAAAALATWVFRPSAHSDAQAGDQARNAGEGPAGTAATDQELTEEEQEACRRARLALRECQRDIEGCRSELRTTAAGPDAASAAPSEVDCLARPEVLAELDRRTRAAASRAVDEERARVRQETETRNDSARRVMERALGLSQEESGWINDFVCLAQNMQDSATADVAAGRLTPEEAWRRLTTGRRAVLRELKDRFPPGRLPQTPELGALLVMLRSFDCRAARSP